MKFIFVRLGKFFSEIQLRLKDWLPIIRTIRTRLSILIFSAPIHSDYHYIYIYLFTWIIIIQMTSRKKDYVYFKQVKIIWPSLAEQFTIAKVILTVCDKKVLAFSRILILSIMSWLEKELALWRLSAF